MLTCCQNSTQTTKLKPNQTLFDRTYSNLTFFLNKKTLKHFNDFKNQNISVLWLKGTQTMELKQNQTFFHRTFLNLTSYIYVFLSKIIKVFKCHSKSSFSSFYDLSKPKQWKWNIIIHCSMRHIQIWLHIFF